MTVVLALMLIATHFIAWRVGHAFGERDEARYWVDELKKRGVL